MATAKFIPPLDDTPKEPRVRPRRCPSCQKPNPPTAVKCGVCGYNLDAPPPPPRPQKIAKSTGGGGALKTLLVLLLLLATAAGAAIGLLGWDRAVTTAKEFYYPKPPAAAAPKPAAPQTAKSVRQKTIDTLKADASGCFSDFNDLMDKKKRLDQHTLLQSYQHDMRLLSSVNTAGAGCGRDPAAGDAQKVELCDAAAQLKTCLSTVLQMQRERLAITP